MRIDICLVEVIAFVHFVVNENTTCSLWIQVIDFRQCDIIILGYKIIVISNLCISWRMNSQSSLVYRICLNSSGIFEAGTTVLMTVYILISITLIVVVSNITELDYKIIAQVIMTMVTFIPFLGNLGCLLCSIFTTWAAVVFRLIVMVTSPPVFSSFEQTLLSTFTCCVVCTGSKVISIIRTCHSFLVWRGPSNSIIALVSIFSLRPVELTFDLIFERWLIDMVFLLFFVFECTEMSLIQVTVSEVWCFLTNIELHTILCAGTDCITLFLGVDFVG